MVGHFSQFLPPPEALKILTVLLLSFLIGLEREEHKANGDYSFGGVRTFPLIGLVGYAVALLSKDQLMPLAIGFAVIGAFLLMSYRHKLSAGQVLAESPGATTEISGLTTYVLGALISNSYFWIAATITVVSLLLLELKEVLEGLSKKLAPHEILTFTKFLLLTGVILPVVPNVPFTQFQINPFKTWLLIVAVCGISYGSYVLLALTRQRDGVLLAGLLGGVYSSTATTVALAKKASVERAPYLFAGGILIASAMMYLRMTILLMLFSGTLVRLLADSADRSGGRRCDYRMALVTSSARESPAITRRGPAQKSVGVAIRICIRRFVCHSLGHLQAGNQSFRKQRYIRSCQRHWSCRRGRLHPGNDSIRRSPYTRQLGR